MLLFPAVLCFVLTSTIALAQGQPAAIAGVVRDGAGVVRRGVTVEVSGAKASEKPRVTVTNDKGAYQVVELRPGVYTVTFTLDGFDAVTRRGVELAAASTVTIDVELRPSTDRGTDTMAVTSRREMDALPTDRTFISFAAMTPGMQVVGGGGHSVGGSLPENAQMLRIHGSRINESRLFVDGMSVMSGHSTGGLALGNFLNNAMAQQIVVNTGSMSAEFEVGGVMSNVVTRSGSNELRGSFIGRYMNTEFQGRNLSADLRDRGLTSSNRIKKIWDANPSAGGPLVKDRAWIFSSFRHWGTYNYVAGLYDDLDRNALFYTPDPTKPSIYPVRHVSADARLTYHATPRNRFSAFYHYQHSDFGTCTSPGPSRQTAPSACAHFKLSPQWFAQGSWTAALMATVLVEAGATVTSQDSSGRRDPGVRADLSSITDTNGFTWRAPADGYGGTRNTQSNYRAAISYVTARHTAKFGLTLLRQWRVTNREHNNGMNFTFKNGAANELTQFAEPAVYAERVNYNVGLYAQDQWTAGRLTVNLGLRADFLNAQVDPQHLPAGRFIPARTFASVKNVPNWQDLSPRLGASYDPFGSGTTAIKATLGRYVLGESYTIARAVNPLESTVSSARRTWNDSNSDFIPDCDLTSVAENGECGPATPNTFGQLIVTTRYDAAVTEGFGVRPFNWMASLTIEQEFGRRLSIFGGYFRRWYGNVNNITKNRAVTNADFDPFCITTPTNSRLPDGGGKELCGFYDVTVDKFGVIDNLITGAKSFGRHEDVFDGLDFTARATLWNGSLISGGLSLGRQRTNNCYVTDDRGLAFALAGASTPRTTPFCDVHPPMQPNAKLQGVYTLPWGIQMAATFQSLPGPQILAQRATANAQIRPSLHRNLASCGTVAICDATVTLDLIPPGTLYGDRINQVDIRFGRIWKTGRVTLRPAISVYNLLNANPVVQYNNRYTSSWPAPLAILTARFADVGVHIDF